MLDRICQELRNWFVLSDDDIIFDTFKIESGVITPSVDLKTGQYFRIVGSTFNDGVYKDGDALVDEEFTGSVWKMSIPIDVISLADEIETYETASGTPSPFSSESFGGYSYTRQFNSWQSAFASKLNRWRKI